MKLVLDASMALSWLLERTEQNEAEQSRQALQFVQAEESLVPALWFAEVTNGILVAERRRVVTAQASTTFRADLEVLKLSIDAASPAEVQVSVLALGRLHGLTGYDATYLELVLRTGGTLATFDRQLAEAVRKAGGRVFCDPA